MHTVPDLLLGSQTCPYQMTRMKLIGGTHIGRGTCRFTQRHAMQICNSTSESLSNIISDGCVRYPDGPVFVQAPWWGPLLFDNESSDARDHCANERSTGHPFTALFTGLYSQAIALTALQHSCPTSASPSTCPSSPSPSSSPSISSPSPQTSSYAWPSPSASSSGVSASSA